MRTAIITPSYRNDFELAKDLCESIDRFVTFEHQHILVVPGVDLKLFSSLRGENRIVLSQEPILQSCGLLRLPVPVSIDLPFFGKRRLRERYAYAFGILSGWVAQQVVKLSAQTYSDADVFIFCDSDVVLVRKLPIDPFFTDGVLNLQQHETGASLETHKLWARNALDLVGKPDRSPSGMNYIGNLIPWSRNNLDALLRRIEASQGEAWTKAVFKKKNISEYITYGQHAVACLDEGVDYVAKDMKLYRSVWSPDARVDVEAVIAGLEPETVAFHIQSTNSLPLQERREAVRRVTAHLAGEAP